MIDKTYDVEYFDWLYGIACGNQYIKRISYNRLLEYLHSVPFRYSIPKDHNRAEDGINMRYKFKLCKGYFPDHDGPCSVLEMMLALAIRCESEIMDDPAIGDRTAQWFWIMITNLGLGFMTDSRFDQDYVSFTVSKFLDREYEPDGKGGLFVIKHCDYDMRSVEIWHQLCWYLDTIT